LSEQESEKRANGREQTRNRSIARASKKANALLFSARSIDIYCFAASLTVRDRSFRNDSRINSS